MAKTEMCGRWRIVIPILCGTFGGVLAESPSVHSSFRPSPVPLPRASRAECQRHWKGIGKAWCQPLGHPPRLPDAAPAQSLKKKARPARSGDEPMGGWDLWRNSPNREIRDRNLGERHSEKFLPQARLVDGAGGHPRVTQNAACGGKIRCPESRPGGAGYSPNFKKGAARRFQTRPRSACPSRAIPPPPVS